MGAKKKVRRKTVGPAREAGETPGPGTREGAGARVEPEPLKARPLPPPQPPPFTLNIDPKKIDESIEELRRQVGKFVRRGFGDKVRILYKGKPLAPDIPIAYFVAAEALTFWSTGILRALILNLGAKAFLEVRIISSAEEHYHRGMERYLAGDVEEALAAFRRGVESDDYHAGCHLMIGVVQKVRGDRADAKKHFQVAAELDKTGEVGAKAREHLAGL